MTISNVFHKLRSMVGRGRSHREHLAEIPTRIVVTGTHGSSRVTRLLCRVFAQRGYATNGITTSRDPGAITHGFEFPIDNTPGHVFDEIQNLDPADILIVENRFADEQTMRYVNSQLVDPQYVVVTNVRPDFGWLGDTRSTARSIARSVPSRTPVVSGEDDADVHRYLDAELAHRDAPLTHVPVPDEHTQLLGADGVYTADWLTRVINGAGLGGQLDQYLESGRLTWTEIPRGRIHVADGVTDIETLDRVRTALCGDGAGPIQPLLIHTNTHPARSASYVRYVNRLARDGLVKQARVVGNQVAPISRSVDVPILKHRIGDPASVLTAAISDGWPIIAVADAHSSFLTALTDEVDNRATQLRPKSRPVGWSAGRIHLLPVPEQSGPARCLRHLSGGHDNTIVVDHHHEPRVYFDEWAPSGYRTSLTVISMGPDGTIEMDRDPTVSLENIPEPGGLEDLFVILEAYLAGVDSPAICYNSVTALLQTVERRAGLELLRILAHLLAGNYGYGYFYFEPEDDQARTLDAVRRALFAVDTRV